MTAAGSNAASAYRSYGAKRLAEYLRAERERIDGDLYVNGDRLAEDLGRPPAEIERHLRSLSGSAPRAPDLARIRLPACGLARVAAVTPPRSRRR
jgi:hypothetical protein